MPEDGSTCFGAGNWPKGQPPLGPYGHQDLEFSSAGSCGEAATGTFLLPYL